MKKALMIAGMFCACSAFADPVVINGNYTLNVGDAKAIRATMWSLESFSLKTVPRSMDRTGMWNR